jgi:phosphohistidine phosphatase
VSRSRIIGEREYAAAARGTIVSTMATTRQLFILRHAKSSWENPGLDDHERPLAPRGRQAVNVLAEYLKTSGIRPALVLCSSSRRTLETLEGVAPEGEQLIEPELYSASGPELHERLRRVPEGVGSVMVIGHNPAMQTIVLRLAGGGSELEAVRRKFPTGALAALTFEGSWSELASGGAWLDGFVRPKALARRPGLS